MGSLVDTGHTVPPPQQPLTTIHVPHLEGIGKRRGGLYRFIGSRISSFLPFGLFLSIKISVGRSVRSCVCERDYIEAETDRRRCV